MNETRLAISFLNGNHQGLSKCRADGALAVAVLLEVQRLGRRADVARFAEAVKVVPKKQRVVPKKPVATRPTEHCMTSVPVAMVASADNGEKDEEHTSGPGR